MQKKLLLSFVLMSIALFGVGQNAWINELHYDNAGGDVGEFLEVVIENPGSCTTGAVAVVLRIIMNQ